MTRHTDIQLIRDRLGDGERILYTQKANPLYHAKQFTNFAASGVFTLAVLTAVSVWVGMNRSLPSKILSTQFTFFVALFAGLLLLVAVAAIISPVCVYIQAAQTSYVDTNWRRFEIRQDKVKDVRYHRDSNALRDRASGVVFNSATRHSVRGPRFGSVSGIGGVGGM